MSTITIPFWIFAISLGVPSLSLLFMVGFMLRKIRNPNQNEFVNMCLKKAEDAPASGHQFHNDLLRMQVDTIFNGLTAIIETERLKINALLNPNHPVQFEKPTVSVEASNSSPLQEPTEVAQEDTPNTVAHSLEQQMVNVVSTDEDIDEIATELGLSQAEIDLAKRMRSSSNTNRGQKLEAVA